MRGTGPEVRQIVFFSPGVQERNRLWNSFTFVRKSAARPARAEGTESAVTRRNPEPSQNLNCWWHKHAQRVRRGSWERICFRVFFSGVLGLDQEEKEAHAAGRVSSHDGTPQPTSAARMSHRSGPARAYDFLLKFLLVGDSDVGKGEILASLQDGASESPYGHNMGEWQRSARSAWGQVI